MFVCWMYKNAIIDLKEERNGRRRGRTSRRGGHAQLDSACQRDKAIQVPRSLFHREIGWGEMTRLLIGNSFSSSDITSRLETMLSPDMQISVPRLLQKSFHDAG